MYHHHYIALHCLHRFYYYCHYAVTILSLSTVTVTRLFLSPTISIAVQCHTWLSLSLSTGTVTSLFVVPSPLQSTVHCPLSTVAFTITVTMPSVFCDCPLLLTQQCSSYHQYCTQVPLLAVTVHCALCTVAVTIAVAMQSLPCHCPLSL